MLDNANSKGKINDSISLSFLPVVKYYYNSNENTTEKLFKEILFRMPVIKYKYTCFIAVGKIAYQFAKAKIEALRYLYDNQNKTGNHNNGL